MHDKQNDISDMINAEMSQLLDQGITEKIRTMLVFPEEIQCAWQYKEWQHDTNNLFPCWKVLVTEDNACIVYCEYGFGPRYPWGLISIESSPPSMGDDSSWHASFVDAVADLIGISPAEIKHKDELR